MDVPESRTHSFIVRVWSERIAAGSNRIIWRGHITHVPSGKRRHLQDMDDVAFFMAPYLHEMGVRLPTLWRVRQWLKQKQWKP
jgi:hypothetical protein